MQLFGDVFVQLLSSPFPKEPLQQPARIMIVLYPFREKAKKRQRWLKKYCLCFHAVFAQMIRVPSPNDGVIDIRTPELRLMSHPALPCPSPFTSATQAQYFGCFGIIWMILEDTLSMKSFGTKAPATGWTTESLGCQGRVLLHRKCSLNDAKLPTKIEPNSLFFQLHLPHTTKFTCKRVGHWGTMLLPGKHYNCAFGASCLLFVYFWRTNFVPQTPQGHRTCSFLRALLLFWLVARTVVRRLLLVLCLQVIN